MNGSAERKQLKKRKSMKIFWVRKLYHETEKERDRNIVMDLHLQLQYNCSFYLHNSILLSANMKNYFLWEVPFSQRNENCSLRQKQNYLCPSFHLTDFFQLTIF